MKDNLDLVEKLVEKTGLSYTDAKSALEKADWDILEAIINLEAEGKVGGTGSYSTRTASSAEQQNDGSAAEAETAERKKNTRNEEYKKTTVSVLEWLRSVFDKGNTNNIELYNKNGERVLGMPVTVFVVLCLISVGTVLVLMLVSLFFGVRYRFSGPELGKESINNVMSKATDVADNIKNDIKNAAEKNSSDNNS